MYTMPYYHWERQWVFLHHCHCRTAAWQKAIVNTVTETKCKLIYLFMCSPSFKLLLDVATWQKSDPLSGWAWVVIEIEAVDQSTVESLLVCVLEMGSVPGEQLGFQVFWKMLFQPCMTWQVQRHTQCWWITAQQPVSNGTHLQSSFTSVLFS